MILNFRHNFPLNFDIISLDVMFPSLNIWCRLPSCVTFFIGFAKTLLLNKRRDNNLFPSKNPESWHFIYLLIKFSWQKMNSDDEDRESSNRDSSSMSDEESDTDIATVLTQLIRRLVFFPIVIIQWCAHRLKIRPFFPFLGNHSGRAHILSERNSVFEERRESFYDFLPNAQPSVDNTPDLTILEVKSVCFNISKDYLVWVSQFCFRELICTCQHPYHLEFTSMAANPIPLVSHHSCINVK